MKMLIEINHTDFRYLLHTSRISSVVYVNRSCSTKEDC